MKRKTGRGGLRARLRDLSLKSAFVLYMLVFLALGAFLASLLSSLATNLEYDMLIRYGEAAGIPEDMEFQFFTSGGVMWENGTFLRYSGPDAMLLRTINVISGVGGPLVFFLFAVLAGRMFYRRRLKEAIVLLTEAAGKIGGNDLDFTLSYPRHDEMGQLCGAFETMRAALDRNSREAWRTMEDRKRLNAAFSHDLRTPLTVLKGRAQMLEQYARQGELPPERAAGLAQKMSSQVERMERYVDSMSSLQKLEDLELEAVETDPESFFLTLREEAELLCGEQGKELLWSQQAGMGPLYLDGRQAARVLENLLGNALRYARRQVEVSFLRVDDRLLLTVTDDGPGFSGEEKARACEPFYRGGREESGAHFGLGLHLCRAVCEKHGGGLRLENAPGGGAMVQASFRISKDFARFS